MFVFVFKMVSFLSNPTGNCVNMFENITCNLDILIWDKTYLFAKEKNIKVNLLCEIHVFDKKEGF